MAAGLSAHPGRSHRFADCYEPVTLRCPGCGTKVRQLRQACAPDPYPPAPCNACALACPGCPAAVVIENRNATVTHDPGCAWLARFRAFQAAATRPRGITRIFHRARTLDEESSCKPRTRRRAS